MTTKKPILVWKNDVAIAQGMLAANNGLPFAQAIYDAYAAIEGLSEFTALAYQDAISDPITFADDTTVEYYQAHFAPLHTPMGIGQDKGMNLVSDKLPDFGNFIKKIGEYRQLFQQHMSVHTIAGPEAYTVSDGKMVVDQSYYDNLTASNQLYLSKQTEFDVKKVLDNLASALKAINEVIPPSIFRLTNGGWGDINLNQLKDLIKVTLPPGGLPIFEVDTQFFFKVHAAVEQQQLP